MKCYGVLFALMFAIFTNTKQSKPEYCKPKENILQTEKENPFTNINVQSSHYSLSNNPEKFYIREYTSGNLRKNWVTAYRGSSESQFCSLSLYRN